MADKIYGRFSSLIFIKPSKLFSCRANICPSYRNIWAMGYFFSALACRWAFAKVIIIDKGLMTITFSGKLYENIDDYLSLCR